MIRVFWCAILLAVLSQSGFAMLRILFSPDQASWAASNIVLVETTPIAGIFAVIESWKGDLSAGSQVVIPDLIPKADAIPISAYPKLRTPADHSDVAEQIPRQRVGSRLVLFLRRNKPEAGDVRKSDWLGWSRSTGEDSMKISAVWIDGGVTYSFTRGGFFTSGPIVLAAFGEYVQPEQRFEPHSEEWLKQDVESVLRVQNEMTAILAEKDGQIRALRLKPYVESKIIPARLLAVEELGKSGPSAVGTIEEMLDDPAYSERAPELVDAMVKAGGKAVGDELNRRFERDVVFWEGTGPSLRKGWWNEDPTPGSPLRNRYGQTYRLVVGLEKIHYAGALNTAIELRDVWRSIPQLNDPSGLNQMAQACEALITQSQNN
jgi:hypothetical protein